MTRVIRKDSDLIQSLNDELEKLKEFYFKVYRENDKKYLGNIASQLRMLVISKGNNVPLLLELMKKYLIDLPLKTNPPPGLFEQSREITIPELLEQTQIKAIKTESQGLVSLTNKQLILKISQQLGGAHQDLKVDEDIIALRDLRILFLNIDMIGLPLQNITKIILEIGHKCLIQIRTKQYFEDISKSASIKKPLKISDYVDVSVNKEKLEHRILSIKILILNSIIISKYFEMKILSPSKKIMGHYKEHMPDDSTWDLKLDKQDTSGNYTTSFTEQGKYSILTSSDGMESNEIFFDL